MTIFVRPLHIFIALLLFTTSALADFNSYRMLGKEQVASIIPSGTRTVIDLSGQWQETGAGLGATSVPNSSEHAQKLVLRRTVKIDANTLASHSWNLQILGARDEIELTINGRSFNRYPGGLVPFTINIPDRALVAGTNIIELALSAPGELATQVEHFGRWTQQQRVGIVREIFLVGTPHVWVSDVRLTTTISGSNGKVVGTGTINTGNVERLIGGSGNALTNGRATVSVTASLQNAEGVVVARGNTNSYTLERARQSGYSFAMDVLNPQLWWPSNPYLYTLVVTVEFQGRTIDSYTCNVGIRTITTNSTERGRRLAINDSVISIHATEYIDEYPGLGHSMSAAQMEQDVQLLKTLGVNVIVFRHGAPHPYMLQLCDKFGLMAFVELSAADIPSGLIEQQELVARYRNAAERLGAYVDTHPSVIACGVSNGLEEGNPAIASFLGSVSKLLRSRTSKLIYKTVPSTLISKTSEGGFDIVIIRFSAALDRSDFFQKVQLALKTIRTAVVLTNYGSLVSPENRNGFADRLSNEAQAVVIRDCFRATQNAGAGGSVVWSFNDYMLNKPTQLVDHHDAFVCTSGLVDIWRQPRVSYTMLKSLINDEKEPLLQANESHFETPLVFIVTGIIIALIITFLINRSRRFREYLLRAIVRPYNFYADIRDQRILSTVQTTLLGSVIAACAGLLLASLVFFVRTDANVEYLLNILIPGNFVHEAIRFVAWRPTLGVVTWSAFVMLIFLFIALLLRIGAMFVKGRIFFRDTLTIVVWSSLPLVVLLPIGIALYPVLSTDAMSFWIPLLIIMAGLWSFIRVLRSTAVVFDVPDSIVYLIGFGLLAAIAISITTIWANSYNLFEFLQYYNAVIVA